MTSSRRSSGTFGGLPCGRATSPCRPCVAASLAAAGCSGDAGTDASIASTTTIESSSAATAQEAYAVGRRSIELVDASRPTAADPSRDWPEEPERTLPVLLLYPADGDVPDTTEPVDDAPVADGAFPLVVFAHGWTSERSGLRRSGSRSGRAPATSWRLPPSRSRAEPRASLTDYPNQPGDVSFVIDELLALPDDDPLAGHIDADAIAAAGHSLGAMTTLGVALNSCCDGRAPRRRDRALRPAPPVPRWGVRRPGARPVPRRPRCGRTAPSTWTGATRCSPMRPDRPPTCGSRRRSQPLPARRRRRSSTRSWWRSSTPTSAGTRPHSTRSPSRRRARRRHVRGEASRLRPGLGLSARRGRARLPPCRSGGRR